MGTHLSVLTESYPMNTNMTGFFANLCILLLWSKVALACEGLTSTMIIYDRSSPIMLEGSVGKEMLACCMVRY